MKILIDGRLLSEKQTGISRYSVELVNMYLNRFGYDKIIVLLDWKYDTSGVNFKYIRTDLKPFNLLDFFLLSRFIKRKIGKIDVYHSLFYSNTYFKLKCCKYVTTVHDLMYLVVNKFFGKNFLKNMLGRIYYNIIVNKSLKNSDIIISVSQTTKNDLYKLFGYNSKVIYEGINYITNTSKAISKLNDKEFFLYVGNSRPHKNIEFLIKSFLSARTNKYFVMAGNNYKSYNKKVISLGYVTDEELSWLYTKCSAFVFPSKYEGFGLPVLEALSKGAIVLSSNGGALSEFPKNVVKYFSPDNSNELKKLLESVDTVYINKEDVSKILKKYRWEEIEKEYNKVFDHYED